MQKIAIFFILMFVLFVINVYAQSASSFRMKAAYQTNFCSGVRDIQSFTNGPNSDYVVSFLPSVGTSLTVEWSFNSVYLDLTYLTNFGVSIYDYVCFNQKIDQVISLNMGFKCWSIDRFTIDAMIGVGYGLSRFFFVNSSRSSYSESLTTRTLVMPFAVVCWFGDSHRERHRIGVSLEYLLPIAPLGHVVRTGFDGYYPSIDIIPSTLSLGVHYQF